MAELFGDLERIAADLYSYRWAIGAGVLIVLAAVASLAYRREWHMVFWRRRLTTAIVGGPLLALVGFVAFDLGSPLFTNKTVEEEFPFAYAAIVPPDMDRADVEDVMAMMSKVDQKPMKESMDDMMKMAKKGEAEASEASEATPTQAVAVKLKAGSFRDQDNFHKGSGQAAIYRVPDGSHLLRLDDFNVTNGPDLHVILSPHPNPGSQNDLKTPGYVDLAKLKGNIGSQNYPIPDDVDVGAIESVVIYCSPFHVIFSVATLDDAN